MTVQHSTSRRTLCQGSLLHSHSSPHPGQQLAGTSASGIPSLEGQTGSILARGTANCVLVSYQSDVKGTCCMTVVFLSRGGQKNLNCLEAPLVE